MISQLPVEIWNYILGESDPADVANISLVNHHLRQLSRPLLFRTFYVQKIRRETIYESDNSEQYNYKDFHHFQERLAFFTSPDLASSVRALVISSTPKPVKGFDSDFTSCQIILQHLFQGASSFHNLTNISILHCPIDNFVASQLFLIPSLSRFTVQGRSAYLERTTNTPDPVLSRPNHISIDGDLSGIPCAVGPPFWLPLVSQSTSTLIIKDEISSKCFIESVASDPLFFMPSLLRLKLNSDCVDDPHFLLVLARCPALEVLDLSPPLWWGGSTDHSCPEIPQELVPRLRRVDAPLSYLPQFHTHRSIHTITTWEDEMLAEKSPLQVAEFLEPFSRLKIFSLHLRLAHIGLGGLRSLLTELPSAQEIRIEFRLFHRANIYEAVTSTLPRANLHSLKHLTLCNQSGSSTFEGEYDAFLLTLKPASPSLESVTYQCGPNVRVWKRERT